MIKAFEARKSAIGNSVVGKVIENELNLHISIASKIGKTKVKINNSFMLKEHKDIVTAILANNGYNFKWEESGIVIDWGTERKEDETEKEIKFRFSF